jgi:hypothetical protein
MTLFLRMVTKLQLSNDTLKYLVLLNTKHCLGLEVLTSVGVESSVFWDITLCSPLKVNRYAALYPRRYNSPSHNNFTI